jgi:hypothetical protein
MPVFGAGSLYDYVSVFRRFLEDVVRVTATRADLHLVFPGEFDRRSHELLADILTAKAFVHLSVVYDHQVGPMSGVGQFGDPFAVSFDKKSATAPVFVTLNLHIFYYSKGVSVRQILLRNLL